MYTPRIISRHKTALNRTAKAALTPAYNRAELMIIDSLGTQVDLAEGTTLMTEGSVGNEAFLILDGSASVTRNGETIATVGPRDFVGESSLMTGETRNATVVTTTPVSALVFSAREFRWMCVESERIGSETKQLVANRRTD